MIPIVDLSSCLGGATEGKEDLEEEMKKATKATAKKLHDAISEHGFCFLENHGIPQSVLDNALSTSKAFFQLPDKVKMKFVRPEELLHNHGWVASERERLNPERPHSDLKEAFNFSHCEQGAWPTDEVPEMRRSFVDVYRQCQQLSYRVLDLLCLALEFKDHGFLQKCHQFIGGERNFTTLRSLYYPPSLNAKEGQIQCGEHSDYGTVTLLFQDETGGLQVLGKDGQYHDVTPIPGTILVNIGDLMQRWTADQYPATKHRVIVPRQAVVEGRARQSMVFFVHPDNDVLITPLDGSNKYPPVTSYDYLMQRYGLTY